MCSIGFLAHRAGVARCCLKLREARVCGFSLGELLIALAIAAILAAVAYPSYLAYKVRANRAAAQSFLIDVANRQHLHFLDARRFATSLSVLGIDPVPAEVAAYYVVADPVVDNAAFPPAFMLSAAARPGTIQARDGDLSLDSSGVRAGHW
jgi:type IV pilus assembly protein PilE